MTNEGTPERDSSSSDVEDGAGGEDNFFFWACIMFLNWSIIALQSCVSSGCMTK